MDEWCWVIANEVIRWGTLALLVVVALRLLSHKQRMDGLESRVADARHEVRVLREDVMILAGKTQTVHIVSTPMPAAEAVPAVASTPTDCGT